MDDWFGKFRIRITRFDPVRGSVKRILCVEDVDELMFAVLNSLRSKWF
jgi:hypothetical protein